MSLCKFGYCTYQNYSHGYCKSHQWCRTDEAWKKSQERAREKKYGAKKDKPCRDINFGFDSEIEMFRFIWNERPHVCQYTGENLEKFYGTGWWVNCFAHVIPKGRFPYFKMNPEAVQLVYPSFHEIVDQGALKIREDYPKWDFKSWDRDVQRMKEKYMKFKKENLLP